MGRPAEALFQLAELDRVQGRVRDADKHYQEALAADRAAGQAASAQLSAHLQGYERFLASTKPQSTKPRP